MTDQEQPDRDPYEPEINDRGMAYMPALDGIGGEAVRVHDSSLAGTDAVWLYIDTTAGDKTGAQLPFTEAFKLASQVYTLAERRGYPVPVPVVPRTRRDVKLGDPVNVTNPDGSSFTATIRTLSEDGTFTAVGNAPESAPPARDEDYPDSRYARDYTPRGYPYENMRSMPGTSNGPTPDGKGPRPLAVILDEDITALDAAVVHRFERVDDTIFALAERVAMIERARRPMSANDIVKTNGDLARQLHEARRHAAAWEQAAGTANSRVADIKAEKRQLEGELAGMHDRERAVDTLIESVVDGKIRLAEWVDPETPAGRVYELIATLLRQAHDAERQGDASALENVEAAVTTYERGDNPLEIGLPDGTLAVRIALALHNSRQRITELEREMTDITDYVADLAGGDDDDTPLTRVRAAVDNLGARARIEGIAEFVERQATEYRKHSAQAVDEDRALAVRMGVPPSRFLSDGELSERESDAAATIIKAGGEFTASVEGAVAAAEREADTDE